MSTVLKHTTPIARKSHHDDSGYFIDWDLKNLLGLGLTFSQYRALINLRNNKWMIKPGQRYVYQFLVEGGDFWSFRSIPELFDICIAKKLYEY